MDYYNTMPPQQNPQPQVMQSMHYQMVPPEIGQQPDLWDQEKQVN